MFLALAVAFQNCGSGFSTSHLSTSSSSLETSPALVSLPLDPVPENVQISTIASGHKFTEGPVWVASLNSLIYSDISNNTLYRWDAASETTSVFRANASVPNGNLLNSEGQLLTLEGYPQRRVAKTDLVTKETTTVVGTFEGSKFHSPNDLAFHRDGSLYLTDPEYGGTPQAEKELSFRGVYRVSKNGGVSLITKDFDQPNGIAFSPDSKVMYVTDSGRDEIRKFTLDEKGLVVASSVFYKPQGDSAGNAFDGLKVDIAGNVYTSGRKGVTILSPKAELIHFIRIGENTTNVAFGGPANKTLFVTCPTTVRRIELLIPGL